MISNDKNNPRNELLNGERKNRTYRSGPPFPVWSSIHRVVHNRPWFQGLDYSGLARDSRSKIRVQSKNTSMIIVIVIAIAIILYSLDLTSIF